MLTEREVYVPEGLHETDDLAPRKADNFSVLIHAGYLARARQSETIQDIYILMNTHYLSSKLIGSQLHVRQV